MINFRNFKILMGVIFAVVIMKMCFGGDKEVSAEKALAEAKDKAENPEKYKEDVPRGVPINEGEPQVTTSISPKSGGVIIKKSDLGENYPFSGDYCEVICESNAIYAIIDGVSYAVNGTAISRGGKKIDNVWLDDPSVKDIPALKGEKINIQPIITAGMKLCK